TKSPTSTSQQFLNGALTVALPTIGKDLNFLHINRVLIAPVVFCSLVYGCLLLFFGRLGDIVGARTMFVAGSLWCSVWAIASAFTPNVPSFIIFVALQGAGAATNTPGSIRALTSHFPPGNRRSQAFGILGAGQPIGFILGLIAGGLLASDGATWRAIFYIQAGLTFMFSVLGFVAIEKDEEKSKRYTKGLDWCGTVLSTVAIVLLTYSLSESTSAKRGWRTPQIPSLFSVSLLGLGCFVLYQRWRDSKGRSVLVPFRLLNHPESKLGSMTLLVFFAWSRRFTFNSLLYWITLYFQQVNLLTPMQTAVRFIPVAISGIVVNTLTGFVMNRVSGYIIMGIGLLASIVPPMIFAFLNGNSPYWTMTLFILISVVGSDAVYPVGNLHCCSAFNEDSHALAGALFNVAIRIGTSLGLSITSSISTSVSGHYLRTHTHSELSASSPEVLMAGFRAAGWTCCAASGVSFLIALVRFRGIGIVG
ncbi:MFS general substrate transporter, partial [Stereum hirsutum FP-91666 SS1]